MNTLDQMREGFGRAWDAVAEGWHQLQERAAQALTRFNPVRHGGGLETADEQMVAHASRWGVLAAEVHETDKEVTVRLEVPGMEREQFEIEVVDGRTLVVRGEKRVEREQMQGRYHVMERAYGSFERAIPLPTEVDDSKARANYRRGVLRVEIPKSASARQRRIQVEQG